MVVRFAASLLFLALLTMAVIVGVVYLFVTFAPSLSALYPRVQAGSYTDIINVVSITLIVISLLWYGYQLWRRRRIKSWYDKGMELARQERYEEALAAYEQAIAIIARIPHAWLNKGVTLVRLGRYDEALAAINHALKLDPTDPLAWNNKADILCENLKHYDEAIAVCDAA
ncbi:MAG TPA: tetratricopeptide repeat protein, partial [Ktedonobacterales bacterium]|nr:tetratricopeptide repeat protein [Ktedonobacterales bacterium]